MPMIMIMLVWLEAAAFTALAVGTTISLLKMRTTERRLAAIEAQLGDMHHQIHRTKRKVRKIKRKKNPIGFN